MPSCVEFVQNWWRRRISAEKMLRQNGIAGHAKKMASHTCVWSKGCESFCMVHRKLGVYQATSFRFFLFRWVWRSAKSGLVRILSCAAGSQAPTNQYRLG